MIDEKKNMCGQKMLSQGTSIFNFSRYIKKKKIMGRFLKTELN